MLGPVRRKRRVLPLALLALLVAINAFLIALLMRSQGEVTAQPISQLTPSNTLPTEPSTTSAAQSASSWASPTPEPSPSRSTEPEVVVPTRLLLATSSKEAWRATVGDCQTHGRVERSANGGKSWQQALEPPLGPIVRLGVEPNGNVYTLGGAGTDCSIRYISYAEDGVVAAQTNRPRGIWSRDPGKPDKIRGPGSARATPCKAQHVLGLASLSGSEALVVCTGGSVIVMSNSGRSWRQADKLVGTMAVGAGAGRIWVAGKEKKCDGVAIQSLTLSNRDLSRGRSRCAPDLTAIPGRVAIDVSGKAIWLWAGDKVQISTDGGRTWT
jgi:hypothetical protein